MHKKGGKNPQRDLMTAITVKKVRIETGSKIKSKRHRREETMRERERERESRERKKEKRRAILFLRKGTAGQRRMKKRKDGKPQ